MGFRKNKALKVFVILLFSFEMIAPALISSVRNQNDGQTQEARFYSNDNHFTNLALSLLCEEETGEEDETPFEFIDTPSLVFINEFRQTPWTQSPDITSSRPRLFALFHSYII